MNFKKPKQKQNIFTIVIGLVTAFVLVGVIVAGVTAYNAFQNNGVFNEDEFTSSRAPDTTTETVADTTTSLPEDDLPDVTTTTVPPVVETASTTTTSPTTTTTTTTTTTLPGFYHGLNPMEPGLLWEYSVPQIGQKWAAIAVIVLEKGQKTIPVPWKDEPTELWVTRFDMGKNPDPDIEAHIITELVHSDLWRDDITGVCTIRNNVRHLPGDPQKPEGAAADIWCRAESQEVAVEMLEIGRLYVVDLLLSVDCSKYPVEMQDVRVQELCFHGIEERAEGFAYNRQLVEALKGGEMPNGIGISTKMWIPPAGSIIPLTTEE